MAAPRAASTLSKFFPSEAVPVVVPVGVAAALFSWMMARTIISDPDAHKSARQGLTGMADTTAAARGEGWRGSIRNHFSARVADGAISIFPNKV